MTRVCVFGCDLKCKDANMGPCSFLNIRMMHVMAEACSFSTHSPLNPQSLDGAPCSWKLASHALCWR